MSLKGKWVDAEPDRAAACETAFQNGGPRVYTYDDWRQSPSHVSAKRAVECSYDGRTVYARRKTGQRWLWKKWEAA